MFLKILLSIISFSIVYVLLTITFFWNTKYEAFSSVSLENEWIFDLKSNWNSNFIEQKINKWIIKWFFLDRFNKIDNILFSKKDSYTKKELNNKITINISDSKYFFFLADNKNYEILYNWFKLSLVWPAKFYINSEELSKIEILSIDNLLNLDLFDNLNKDLKTRVYIYPHMYFAYKPFSETPTNADLLRVSQIHEFTYINDSLYNLKSDFFQYYTTLDNYFFKNSLKYFYYLQKNSNKIFSEIKSDVKFSIPGKDFIESYYLLFINKSKKTAYLKDLIYSNLLDIFIREKVSSEVFVKTSTYLKDLKELDEKSYNEIYSDVMYFKYHMLFDYNFSIDSADKKEKFYNMLASLENKKFIANNIILYWLSNSYDLWNKSLFLDWLINFSTDFLSKNWLTIDNWKLKWYVFSKKSMLEYYSYYLKNIIETSLTEKIWPTELSKIFNLFNNYSLISYNVYSWSDKETNEEIAKKAKTWFYYHVELLENVNTFIRKYFFDIELKNNDTLISKVSLPKSELNKLNRSFDILKNFSKENSHYIDEIYASKYELINNDYLEYYRALVDYQKYILDKDLLWWSHHGGQEWIVYDKASIINYISNFNWVDRYSIVVKTSDKKIYNISNLLIWWHTFSFDLEPYNSFYLSNLLIDNENKSVTYRLLSLEEERLTKTGVNSDDKDTYDFKNFFINTFLKKSVSPIAEGTWTTNPSTLEEWDRLLEVFKRDYLLSKWWAFWKIWEYFDIKMENIKIEKLSNDYDIKIENAKIYFYYKQNNDISNKTSALLNSDFIYDKENWKNHAFNNLKLKLFKTNNSGWNNYYNFWIWETEILYNWKISILKLKDSMYNLLMNYDSIVSLYTILSVKNKEVNIEYSKSWIIKFTCWVYEIILFNNKVRSVKENSIEKLKSPIEYNMFEDLKLIIK